MPVIGGCGVDGGEAEAGLGAKIRRWGSNDARIPPIDIDFSPDEARILRIDANFATNSRRTKLMESDFDENDGRPQLIAFD